MPATTSHSPNYDQTRMYPYTKSELDAFVLLETSMQISHGIENTEPSTDGSVRIIFMRLRIPKIHQQPVPKVLGNIAIVALDNFRTRRLIGTDDFPVLFGIELRREFRGVHEVTEHHRKLATFRAGRRRHSRERGDLRGGLWLGSRGWCYLSRLRDEGRCFRNIPSPDEYSAIFTRGESLCLDDLRLEGFEILVV